jgi:phosphocarrier protein HPr
MSTKVATGSVLLKHEGGLHARPSVKLTKLAKTFASRVEIATVAEGPWVDTKSVKNVMGAKVRKNTLLCLRAEGEDAQAAIDSLIALVESDFADAPAGQPGDLAHAGTG